MTPPVFLLGAGFNADARRHAGPITGHSIYCGEYEIDCGYPLVPQLGCICFGRDLKEDESIEELFAAAIREKNPEPLKHLCHALMQADNYLVPRLMRANANPYALFFKRFGRCHFLTFNYDSLTEIFLYHQRVWYPQDGYGVPVRVELDALAREDPRCLQSVSYVLHLHGSLCIYPSTYDPTDEPNSGIQWLTAKEHPDYIFDPDAISSLFRPYRRLGPVQGYELPWHRVIAPVPDKAEGLRAQFVRAVHSRATSILSSSQQLIAIGYSFNVLDRRSYHRLLTAFSQAPHPQVLLVCPDADKMRPQLLAEYPRINWVAQANTFESWVETGFRGELQT